MLSIIVTHKKHKPYLKDCLDSIAEQNITDYETILVVDHTEDNLDKLINKYTDKINLKVYYLEDKTGVSAARNLGLEKATGDYVAFLDNDDYYLPGSLNEMLQLFDDETDIVYSRFKKSWFGKETFLEKLAEKEAERAAQEADEEDDDSDNDNEEDNVSKDADKFFKRTKKPRFDFENYFEYKIQKFRKLEKISVLGIIYRKLLWDDNDIRFMEDLPYFADAPIAIKLFKASKGAKSCEEAKYVRRLHNDRYKNPSLNQTEREITMPYLFKSYDAAMEVAKGDKKLEYHLYLVLGKFITKPYLRKIRTANEEWEGVWEHEYFEELKKRANNINLKVITRKNFKFGEIKMIKVMQTGDFDQVYKQGLKVLFRRKLKKVLTKRSALKKSVSIYIFGRMKFQPNWIVFESFLGRNCSGQPKYIYQYLQEHYPDKYKCIWVVSKRGVKIPGNYKKCRRFSFKYYYYMNRSKYWVNNMRQPLHVPKRDETIILATWHGTPLKRLVFDMEDVLSATPKYKSIVYRQSRKWNYLLSDNPFSTEVFQSCFLFDRENILEAGYPANDPLYASDKEERAEKIKKKLGIPKDKKVILYAPTWRDDNFFSAGQYGFELDLDLNRLKKEFGDEYVVLLRLHYFVVEQMDLSKYGDFTIDGCSYDDITDLYLVSDILMTDYSSVFFDYANLQRPILFFTYDLDRYRDVLRGFYLDMEKDLPGPLLITNDDVVDAIKNIDEVQEEYEDKYKEFYDRFCCVDDGNAAKRVVEAVFEEI